INSFCGGAVEAPSRSQQKLFQIRSTAANIAAYQIGVIAFEAGGNAHAALQDQLAKSGRESLDLLLDGIGHIHGRSIWHMAICPGGVFSDRRAALIEERRLCEQHKGPCGMLALPGIPLGGGDFVESAS